jgi:hypothetical protein
MTTATYFVTPARATPRGAILVGKIHDFIMKMVIRHRAARAEATRELEAEYVRRYARDIEASDPGFAADLYAAADRHENI